MGKVKVKKCTIALDFSNENRESGLAMMMLMLMMMVIGQSDHLERERHALYNL